MKINVKNKSHRYDINRPRSRHGHKRSKYKKGLSMMSQFIKKLYNTEAELEKSIAYKKKRVLKNWLK